MSSAAGARQQGVSRPERASSVPPQVRRTLAAKRLMDLTLGSVLAVFALPVILVLTLVMAWSLRAWPLFVQRRIGRYGREFSFPKIRTLPKTIGEYTSKNEFDDTAIPRLGQFLRRRHLDELPQLFLVPFGKMSLVGPRPKMPDSIEPIDPEYGRLRIQVQPGCTGLWQIGAHAHRQVSESPGYDLFYLRYGSLRLDLWILWRTAITGCLGGSGIHLDRVPRWIRGNGLLPTEQVPTEIDVTPTDAPEVVAVAGR